jgi:hypothetical protein
MSTTIKIERLVIDGIELSRRERDALGPAIARELRRLAGGPAREPADSGEPRHRSAGSAVDGIAREVAAAVHRATATARGRPAAAPRARPTAGPVAGRPSARAGQAAQGGRR